MFLEHILEGILPYIITSIELVGVFVVCITAIKGFVHYIAVHVLKKQYDIKFELADGLATGLEFKMAAEILKTLLIQSLDELYILGAVIVLRALLSFMIHFEMHTANKAKHG